MEQRLNRGQERIAFHPREADTIPKGQKLSFVFTDFMFGFFPATEVLTSAMQVCVCSNESQKEVLLFEVKLCVICLLVVVKLAFLNDVGEWLSVHSEKQGT